MRLKSVFVCAQALSLCGLFWASVVSGSQPTAETISLSVSNHKINAEVVASDEGRMKGLMQREKLGKNDGMLFVFNQVGYHGMWMKNTLIPLSVAFIDEQGRILNIADMEPHSELIHSAAGPALYALETNVGWFKVRRIVPGAVVKGLERAPKGR